MAGIQQTLPAFLISQHRVILNEKAKHILYSSLACYKQCNVIITVVVWKKFGAVSCLLEKEPSMVTVRRVKTWAVGQ